MQPPFSTPDRVRAAAAFRLYVEPEIEVLLRVARTLTDSWAEAEDLVQETLVRAWRSVERFDGAHPRAWLLTILRHTNLNMRRRRRPDLVEDAETRFGSRPAFGGRTQMPSAEEQLVDNLLPADLEAAVRTLDHRFRSVLVLVDLHALSYAETAEVLGLPVGTVMSRLSRARDRVRKHLKSGADSASRTKGQP